MALLDERPLPRLRELGVRLATLTNKVIERIRRLAIILT
jgi:hypothetical protein